MLDILVQSRRNARATRRLLRKLLKRQCRATRVVVTDKPASYGAARHAVMRSVEHRRRKGLTAGRRARTSRQDGPTRRRQRGMKGFTSPRQAQRFPSAQDGINAPFLLRRHQVSAIQYRAVRTQAVQAWAEVTGVTAAA